MGEEETLSCALHMDTLGPRARFSPDEISSLNGVTIRFFRLILGQSCGHSSDTTLRLNPLSPDLLLEALCLCKLSRTPPDKRRSFLIVKETGHAGSEVSRSRDGHHLKMLHSCIYRLTKTCFMYGQVPIMHYASLFSRPRDSPVL